MTFAADFEALQAARKRHREEQDALNQELQTAILAAYRERFPTRKAPTWRAIALKTETSKIATEIRPPFEKRAETVMAKQKAERERLEAAADESASALKLTSTPDRVWTRIRAVSSSSYATQGFGATKYAEGSAQITADTARHHGIPAEVRRVIFTRPSTILGSRSRTFSWTEFHVWAALDPSEAPALARKPGPSLRETVRLCWARGVNPRVFNPFLPVGYEEENGLDHHGRDLREAKHD